MKSLDMRRKDHPRIRGEHPASTMSACRGAGSSPHTRGALEGERVHAVSEGIIPAYAGSTGVLVGEIVGGGDHPRIRGEHDLVAGVDLLADGSSPHTRGALADSLSWLAGRWIIPAYAGSTLGNPCNTKDRRRDYTSFPLPVTHPSGGGGS